MGESFTYQIVVRIFSLSAGGWHFLPGLGFFLIGFFFCEVSWDLLVKGTPGESSVNMVWLIQKIWFGIF